MRTLSFAKVPPSWGDPELQVKSLPYCQVEANSSFICLTTTFLPLIKSHCRVESLEILFYHHKCFLLCKLLFIKERIFYLLMREHWSSYLLTHSQMPTMTRANPGLNLCLLLGGRHSTI